MSFGLDSTALVRASRCLKEILIDQNEASDQTVAVVQFDQNEASDQTVAVVQFGQNEASDQTVAVVQFSTVEYFLEKHFWCQP